MQAKLAARVLAFFAVLVVASARVALGACGDGIVDGGEQCDLGAGNGSATSCCTTLCEYRAVGLTCRPTAGDCDVVETCDGVSDQCPADAFQPVNFVCRAPAGGCDVAELCSGSGPVCPGDAVEPNGTVCRAPGGDCDVSEFCDGVGTACPADGFVSSGTTCRTAGGQCDVPEACTGSGPTCPGDVLRPNGFVCRAGTGECDPAETCDGVDIDCPEDAFVPDDTPCDDNSACTDEDLCFRGVCVGTADLDVCIDDFIAYKVKTSTGTPKPTPINGVSLVDDFDSGLFDVVKTRMFGVPADKNAEGLIDAATHLKIYAIRPSPGEPRHTPQTNQRVRNQLGELFLDTIRPDFLLVPAAKNLTVDPTPPVFGSHNVDHYKCYKVKVTAGTPRFPERVFVDFTDQFTSPAKTLRVRRPRHLCTPVDKNGSGIKNPTGHLVCYQVQGRPRHQKRSNVHTADQFGQEQIDTNKEREICIPSERG
jgi:hypothetical protein